MDTTVFSRLAFCRAWGETFGLRWEPLAGREDLGLLYSESSRLHVRDYALGPRGLYWGAFDGAGEAERLVEVALGQCRSRRTLGLTWNFRHDARGQLDAAVRGLGDDRAIVRESTTHVIELDGKSFDEFLERDARPVTRRWVRRSAEAGLDIRPLASEADFRAHEELYRAWAADIGVEVHPAPLFPRLAAALGESVAIAGAFRGDALTAAIVVFRDAREWMYWHGVRDRRLEQCHALDALLAHAIGQACAAGVRSFNLGASKGVASLERFKERWGARPRRVWSLRWYDPKWSALLSGWTWLRRRAPAP